VIKQKEEMIAGKGNEKILVCKRAESKCHNNLRWYENGTLEFYKFV
jgi:hypothetical protein